MAVHVTWGINLSKSFFYIESEVKSQKLRAKSRQCGLYQGFIYFEYVNTAWKASKKQGIEKMLLRLEIKRKEKKENSFKDDRKFLFKLRKPLLFVA